MSGRSLHFPSQLSIVFCFCAFSLKMQMDILVLGCCLPCPWPHPSPAQGLSLTTSFIKDREQASVHLRPDSQPKTCPASREELQTREAANCKPLQTGSAPEGGGWGRARRGLWAATGRGLTDASEGQRAEHEVHDDIIAHDTAAGCPVDHPLDELRGRAEAPGQRWLAQDTCPPRGQTSRASTVQVSSQLHIKFLRGSNTEGVEHPSN